MWRFYLLCPFRKTYHLEYYKVLFTNISKKILKLTDERIYSGKLLHYLTVLAK